jgi:hypothetical protein
VFDAATIVVFAVFLVVALTRGSWSAAGLAALAISSTALTFGKPRARFDPSKSGIQQWKERRRA